MWQRPWGINREKHGKCKGFSARRTSRNSQACVSSGVDRGAGREQSHRVVLPNLHVFAMVLKYALQVIDGVLSFAKMTINL